MKLHPLSIVLRGGNRALGLGIAGFVAGSVGGSILAARGVLPWGGSLSGFPIALLLGGLAIAYEVAYHRRFEYELTARTLDIQSGVFSRRDREIPLRRIQNVDISRTLLVRLLGLAAINVETAGGGSTEAQLRYVRFEEARRLQQGIQQRKHARATEETPSASGAAESTLLFELDDRDLLLYSVLSFDPRVFSVVFFLVPSAAPMVLNRFDPISNVLMVTVGLLGALILAAGIWVMSAFARFVQYYGFKLHRSEDELRYERGLLQRYDGSIPLEKVQSLVVEENVLMRQFGYASLSIETAGYAPGTAPSSGSEAAIPLAKRDTLLALARSIEPFDDLSFERPAPRARRRYVIRYGLVVLAIVLLGAAVDRFLVSLPWYVLAVLFVLVPVAAHETWVHRGWTLTDGYAVARSGFWRRSTYVIPDFRVQTVIERQTIFQRRWNLGSVVIDTASSRSLVGTHPRIIDVNAADASRLRETLADRLQVAIGVGGNRPAGTD